MSSIIAETQAFVRASLAGNDGSHDYLHIQRVHNVWAYW